MTKTKVTTIKTKLHDPITINNNPTETDNDFTYLGSIISSDNGTKKDVKAGLSKAQPAYETSTHLEVKSL